MKRCPLDEIRSELLIIMMIVGFLIPAGLGAQERHSGSNIEFQDRTVIIENIYSVKIGGYQPPLKVNSVEKTAARYQTPEDAAIAQFSAMVKGDHDWWLSGWTDESKILIQQLDVKFNQTERDRIQRWKATLEGKSVFLLFRADYFQKGTFYALIGYVIDKGVLAEDGSKDRLELIMVLGQYGSKWLADQKLADDPVFANIWELWKSRQPALRIQKKSELNFYIFC